MTLVEAHKKLDEEYAKNKTIAMNFRQVRVPDDVRVAAALIKVAEIAKSESSYFAIPHKGV